MAQHIHVPGKVHFISIHSLSNIFAFLSVTFLSFKTDYFPFWGKVFFGGLWGIVEECRMSDGVGGCVWGFTRIDDDYLTREKSCGNRKLKDNFWGLDKFERFCGCLSYIWRNFEVLLIIVGFSVTKSTIERFLYIATTFGEVLVQRSTYLEDSRKGQCLKMFGIMVDT
jgi:hypothetical protein